MKYILRIMLLLLPVSAHAVCDNMWDTAELAQQRKETIRLTGAPLYWFQGIDILRRKIDTQSGISTNLYLCDSSVPNAFAWRARGQNNTAITTGMYRLLGDDWQAYAAIVGHENAHLVKKHGLYRVLRGAALTVLSGHIDLPTIAFDAVNATYGRGEEYDADRYGLGYALCAGFSPIGGVRLHKKLNSASSFLHSHPSSKSRISALQKAAEKHLRAPKCK